MNILRLLLSSIWAVIIYKTMNYKELYENCSSVGSFLNTLSTKNLGAKKIHRNLKDCLKGIKKKCYLFSCGHNLKEHQEKYKNLKKSKSNDYIIGCYKSVITEFLNVCDLFSFGGNLNGSYMEKVRNMENNQDLYTLGLNAQHFFKFNKISPIHTSLDLKPVNKTYIDQNTGIFIEGNRLSCNVASDVMKVIMFLDFIGIKEIYLFGFYLGKKVPNLNKFNFYEDIIQKDFHWYKEGDVRRFEYLVFVEQINSSLVADYLFKKNKKIFNVSKYGCYSNRIPRITYESIDKEDKEFISPEFEYTDLNEQLLKFNHAFYKDNYKLPFKTKEDLFMNYLRHGIYLNWKIHKYDNRKKDIKIDKFHLLIAQIVTLILNKPFLRSKNMYSFLGPEIVKFNKKLNTEYFEELNSSYLDYLYIKKEQAIKLNQSKIDSIKKEKILSNQKAQPYLPKIENWEKYCDLIIFFYFFD